MKNVVRLICDFFQCQADTDLFDAVRSADDKCLGALLIQYRSLAATTRLDAPDVTAGELRPYLPTAQAGTSHMLGHLNLQAKTFSDMGEVWNAVDAIKHKLLYCHSVAIDDCFGNILYDVLKGICNKDLLLNYMNFLLHLNEIIQNDILFLVSPQVYFRDAFEVNKSALGLLTKNYVSSKFDGWTNASPDFPVLSCDDYAPYVSTKVKDMWEQAHQRKQDWDLLQAGYADFEIGRMNAIFGAIEDLPKKITPYLPGQNCIKILTATLSEISFEAKRTANPVLSKLLTRENSLLNELAHLNLPGLSKLDPHDIVAIRKGDSFQHWRDTLRDALQGASLVGADFLDRREAVQADVRHALIPAKEKLELEFARSSVLSRARAPSTEFVAGGLGTLVAYFVDPTASLVVAGAAVAGKIVEVASKAFSEAVMEKGRSPNHALRPELNHFVAMLT